MYTTSYQGIYPFISAGQRSNFYYSQTNYWPNSFAYPPSNGFYQGFNFKQGNVGSFQPILNQGHSSYYQPELQGWYEGYQGQHIQQQKTNHVTKKHQQSNSPIKHHEYHWHHGYPFGQGSGLFPDYYNSTY
ncbi:hypothetical protein BTR23_14715 [Alkalihalophilus pseudofirmus]|nr:hypothetical protein BTR23_14715 [Alkalihalophilus pseudofirmus]